MEHLTSPLTTPCVVELGLYFAPTNFVVVHIYFSAKARGHTRSSISAQRSDLVTCKYTNHESMKACIRPFVSTLSTSPFSNSIYISLDSCRQESSFLSSCNPPCCWSPWRPCDDPLHLGMICTPRTSEMPSQNTGRIWVACLFCDFPWRLVPSSTGTSRGMKLLQYPHCRLRASHSVARARANSGVLYLPTRAAQ